MYHWYKLSVSTSVTTVCAELAWPESCHKRSNAIDTAMAVGGVSGNELIGVATEFHDRLFNKIQEDKFVICNDSQLNSPEHASYNRSHTSWYSKTVRLPSCLSRVNK
jgi:hypothetical protein